MESLRGSMPVIALEQSIRKWRDSSGVLRANVGERKAVADLDPWPADRSKPRLG